MTLPYFCSSGSGNSFTVAVVMIPKLPSLPNIIAAGSTPTLSRGATPECVLERPTTPWAVTTCMSTTMSSMLP